MTRTRSRNDKDKEQSAHTGAQPHWSMSGGHTSGATGGIEYHRSGQTRQGRCIFNSNNKTRVFLWLQNYPEIYVAGVLYTCVS